MLRLSRPRFIPTSSSIHQLVRKSILAPPSRHAIHHNHQSNAMMTTMMINSKRTFFFSSKKEGDTTTIIADASSEQQSNKETLQVKDGDLALGNDMPPLLQYNENLVAAALRLVEYANEAATANNNNNSNNNSSAEENAEITPEVEAGIANIMAMLFHEEFIPIVSQFQAIRELVKLDGIRKNPKLLEAVHEITAALVPDPVMGLIVTVDKDIENFDIESLEDVNHFICLILEGQENDDDFVRALQTMQNRNPELEQSTPFIVLMQKMNDVLLQSRLSYLLTEACLTFDPERTGKIKLVELEESLQKILPKEAVSKMMEAVEADDEGKVPYAQMTRVLLRGKDIEIVATQ